MKLPENKRDRAMVLILAGIGALAVLYAVFQLALKPFISSWRGAADSMREIEAKLAEADAELAKVLENRKRFNEISAELDHISREYVLQPVLGTFLLGVQDKLEGYAQTSGVKLDSVREIGIVDLIPSKGKTERMFRSYGVQVTGFASFRSLIRFLQQLEANNPYLCVASITISSRQEEPETHRVSLTIQWPVWKDLTIPPSLQEANPDAL